MGKINGCLKCLFIFFNVLFAKIGCLLILSAIMSSVYIDQVNSRVWSWLFAIGVLGISWLGIYAGSFEKEILLKIFAGFMVVGMIIMLIFGIFVAVKRNKIKSDFTEYFMKNEELRKKLNGLQQYAHCCGMVSASDWGDNIPSSCKCSRYGWHGGSECTSKPQGVSGPDQIYAQPCGQIMFVLIDLVLKIAMGVCFGFAVTALLGLLVTLLMIRQVRRPDSSGGTSIAMRGY